MGKGRDKRKKHEDPIKAVQRAVRSKAKEARGAKGADGEEPDRFNNEENIEVTMQRIRKQQSKVRTTVEQPNVPPPEPRINSVVVKHPTRDTDLFIFGGDHWNGAESKIYDDIYLYNTKRRQWARVVAGGPSARSSAQAVVYKQFVILHGGEYASRSQSQFMHFKDVWRFDANTYIWEELSQLKGGPSSRSGHRMALWKRNAVVFGGFYDNGLETRYFNDLWVLSNMDAQGKWTEVVTPTHGEAPHVRSGHCLGLYEDTVFVYGGYSTEKGSRFKKAEATVHHDLWSINLSNIGTLDAAPPMWTRVKMGGIPPPIRSGVAGAIWGKKLLLFGGVVDIDAPGGKTMSSFHNDLFVFHMDTGRFFPLVLQKPKKLKKGQGKKDGDDDAQPQKGDLAAELAALGAPGAGESSSSSDDDDDHNDKDDAAKEPEEVLKVSYEEHRGTGQITPHRRMDSAMLIDGHTLWLYGGIFEQGKKETTLGDLFSLNLNRMDTYDVHHSTDLTASRWVGEESGSEGEDDGKSWESGSTVMSEDMMGRYDDDDDDLEDDLEDAEAAAAGPSGPVDLKAALAKRHNDDDDDDGDDVPMAIPADSAAAVAAGGEDLLDNIPRGRVSVKGKKSMKLHKAQLESQLGADAAVPTPLSPEEPLKDFAARTEAFWLKMALEALRERLGEEQFAQLQTQTQTPSAAAGSSSGETDAKSGSDLLAGLSERLQRRCRSEATKFAQLRHAEAVELMQQLATVEQREEEERVYFANLREAKRRVAEEEEAAAAAEEAAEEAAVANGKRTEA